MAIKAIDVPARYRYTAHRCVLSTDSAHNKARIQAYRRCNIRAELAAARWHCCASRVLDDARAIINHLGAAARTPPVWRWLLR